MLLQTLHESQSLGGAHQDRPGLAQLTPPAPRHVESPRDLEIAIGYFRDIVRMLDGLEDPRVARIVSNARSILANLEREREHSDIDDDHLISEVPAAAKELAGVAAGAVASELISRLASGKES